MKILLVVIIAAVAARAALTPLCKAYINRSLQQAEGYDARIGGLSLGFIRGEVGFKDIRVAGADRSNPVRYFTAEQLNVDFEWKPLLKKMFVANARLVSPKLTLAATPEAKKKDAEAGEKVKELKNDADKAKQGPSFRIEKVDIADGKFEYLDPQKSQGVLFQADQIQAEGANITNCSELTKNPEASVKGRARVPKNGTFEVSLWLDQCRDQPTFELNSELRDLDLVEMNGMMRAYGNFDVQSGTFNMATEFAAADGRFKGYVKPTVDHLQVIDWKKDVKKPAQLLKKVLVGTPASLKNEYRDRLGSKIPLSGKFEGPKVAVWSAAASLFRNAFLQALFPGVEGTIRFWDVKES